MAREHVHILKMGGTIEFHDPAYEAINAKLLKLNTSIDSYLKDLVQPYFDFSSEIVCEKDSREITKDDRNKLLRAIQETSHTNILVTHGTFTMVETVKSLEEAYPKGKKVIVTGSMIPIIGFASSDAGFNLGFAIASFPHVETGTVHLAMNGGLFSGSEVAKNEEAFRFEWSFPASGSA